MRLILLFSFLVSFMFATEQNDVLFNDTIIKWVNILILTFILYHIQNFRVFNRIKKKYTEIKETLLLELEEKRKELIKSYVEKYSSFNRSFEYIESILDKLENSNIDTCQKCAEDNIPHKIKPLSKYYEYSNKDGSPDRRRKDNNLIIEYIERYECPTCKNKWDSSRLTKSERI